MATKVDLHKTTAEDKGKMEAAKQIGEQTASVKAVHTPLLDSCPCMPADSTKDTDPNAELDVQDFQKAGEQACLSAQATCKMACWHLLRVLLLFAG